MNHLFQRITMLLLAVLAVSTSSIARESAVINVNSGTDKAGDWTSITVDTSEGWSSADFNVDRLEVSCRPGDGGLSAPKFFINAEGRVGLKEIAGTPNSSIRVGYFNSLTGTANMLTMPEYLYNVHYLYRTNEIMLSPPKTGDVPSLKEAFDLIEPALRASTVTFDGTGVTFWVISPTQKYPVGASISVNQLLKIADVLPRCK